jgi:tRNA threonylcarbamoyladenosine biosynthesis protein TsaB
MQLQEPKSSAKNIAENPGPLILAIETATRAGSVALARGAEILWSALGDSSASHSTDLIETVEKGLNISGIKLSEIELFAAARGPGSFTGLRIGLATIKAFAVCSGRRCAGVSTLAAIAHAAGPSDQTVSLLPAGRGELFAQMFSVRDGQARELDQAAHLAPKALLEKYGAVPELIWAGDGAHLSAAVLREWASARHISFDEQRSDDAKRGQSERAQSGWTLAPTLDQLATSVAGLALEAHRGGKTVTPADLQAVYVRASDAEINKQWQPEK